MRLLSAMQEGSHKPVFYATLMDWRVIEIQELIQLILKWISAAERPKLMTDKQSASKSICRSVDDV